MNWQTREILDEAIEMVNDEGVFNADQIALIQAALKRIADAMEKESRCIQAGINYSM